MRLMLSTRPWMSSRLLSSINNEVLITSNRSIGGHAKNKNVPKSFSSNTSRKPEFYVPLSERSDRNVFDMDINAGESRLARTDRTCPTRELYFLHSQWEMHKSPYRKFRHMRNLFQSAPLQRLLFPDLFFVASLTAGLTYYNEFVVSAFETASTVSMSPTAFAGATTAIGLLAGFRLNASYARYNEGRKAWSDTQTTLRDLARQIMMWVPEDDDATRIRMIRLCQAFPITLIFHVNDKGCHYNMKRLSRFGPEQFYDRVQVEFEAELYDIYFPPPPPPPLVNDKGISEKDHDAAATDTKNFNEIPALRADYDRLCRVKIERGHVPLEVITCMAEAIGDTSQKHTLHPVFGRALDEKVQLLCKAMGSCERIAKTPLPTGFTRHSSRLLFIWSNCLPFALYPLMGPWGTLPTTLLTSYAVLGIEDISVQLEEPFDVLPLRQFSNTMIVSIQAIESGYRGPTITSSS